MAPPRRVPWLPPTMSSVLPSPGHELTAPAGGWMSVRTGLTVGVGLRVVGAAVRVGMGLGNGVAVAAGRGLTVGVGVGLGNGVGVATGAVVVGVGVGGTGDAVGVGGDGTGVSVGVAARREVGVGVGAVRTNLRATVWLESMSIFAVSSAASYTGPTHFSTFQPSSTSTSIVTVMPGA